MEKTYQVRRLNAVKHGILSKEAVLPHESKDEFEDLLALSNDKFKYPTNDKNSDPGVKLNNC